MGLYVCAMYMAQGAHTKINVVCTQGYGDFLATYTFTVDAEDIKSLARIANPGSTIELRTFRSRTAMFIFVTWEKYEVPENSCYRNSRQATTLKHSSG